MHHLYQYSNLKIGEKREREQCRGRYGRYLYLTASRHEEDTTLRRDVESGFVSWLQAAGIVATLHHRFSCRHCVEGHHENFHRATCLKAATLSTIPIRHAVSIASEDKTAFERRDASHP